MIIAVFFIEQTLCSPDDENTSGQSTQLGGQHYYYPYYQQHYYSPVYDAAKENNSTGIEQEIDTNLATVPEAQANEIQVNNKNPQESGPMTQKIFYITYNEGQKSNGQDKANSDSNSGNQPTQQNSLNGLHDHQFNSPNPTEETNGNVGQQNLNNFKQPNSNSNHGPDSISEHELDSHEKQPNPGEHSYPLSVKKYQQPVEQYPPSFDNYPTEEPEPISNKPENTEFHSATGMTGFLLGILPLAIIVVSFIPAFVTVPANGPLVPPPIGGWNNNPTWHAIGRKRRDISKKIERRSPTNVPEYVLDRLINPQTIAHQDLD